MLIGEAKPAVFLRTVEFVHGINGNRKEFECGSLRGAFQAILSKPCQNKSAFNVDSLAYYQDKGHYTGGSPPCDNMPAADTNTGILYVDPDSISPNICDSEGALAYSVTALDDRLNSLPARITVIANSMDCAITRGWLALANSNGPSDKSLSKADSVIFLQGAQAGS